MIFIENSATISNDNFKDFFFFFLFVFFFSINSWRARLAPRVSSVPKMISCWLNSGGKKKGKIKRDRSRWKWGNQHENEKKHKNNEKKEWGGETLKEMNNATKSSARNISGKRLFISFKKNYEQNEGAILKMIG